MFPRFDSSFRESTLCMCFCSENATSLFDVYTYCVLCSYTDFDISFNIISLKMSAESSISYWHTHTYITVKQSSLNSNGMKILWIFSDLDSLEMRYFWHFSLIFTDYLINSWFPNDIFQLQQFQKLGRTHSVSNSNRCWYANAI